MDKNRLTYDILNDGYMIKLDGKDWIEQVGENSKPMDSTKTLEENCLLQIEDLTTEVEEETNAVTMESLKETNDSIGSQLSQTLIQVMMLEQQVAALTNTPE